MTLQRALDQLTRDGFIYARGNMGTFVSDHPPHLFSYALVFHCTPDDKDWSRFWSALSNQAFSLERSSPVKISCYYRVHESSDNEDYQRLLHDIRARRLAGLIFSSLPADLVSTPLVEDPQTPRVALMVPRPGCNVPAVYPDLRSFVDRALDSLAAKNRRRIGVLSNQLWWEQMGEHFQEGIHARGLEWRPYWTQTGESGNALRAANLLMHSEQKTRPDGLIIADDNLVEHAIGGLLAAGVRVPQDVDVIAHCNFPWPASSVLQVQRLGFDARKVMSACLESIDMQRRGETPPSFVAIAAQFEDEVKSLVARRDELLQI